MTRSEHDVSEHVASPPCTRGHIRESSLRAATSRANSPLECSSLERARVRSDLVRHARHGVRVARLRPGESPTVRFSGPPRGRESARGERREGRGTLAMVLDRAPSRRSRAFRASPRPRTLVASSRDDDDAASVAGETDVRSADADDASSSSASDDVDAPPLVPRTFAAIDEIVARAPTEVEATAALAAAKQAVLDATEPLPWHQRPADRPERHAPETRDVDGASLDRDLGDPSDLGSNPSPDSTSFSFRDDSLDDAAFVLGWRVVDANTGAVVGDVKHALAMAGGEVVAQLGDEEEDEHDAPAGDFFFSPPATADDEDDRDDDEDDEDDWEVIYEGEDSDGISSLGSGEGDRWSDAASSSDSDLESFDAFDDDGAPPLSVVLRVRGEREVSGAGGAVNLTPVVHLVPLRRRAVSEVESRNSNRRGGPPRGSVRPRDAPV